MNRRQNKQKSQAKGGLKDLKDDPDHYRIKSVDSKHNVFNRKLLRKAKRKGVKDLEQYLVENTKKGKASQQLKGTKAKMAAKNAQRAQVSENSTKQAAKKELGLKDIYTKEAEQEYLQKMIEEDEREIRLYEKKLGMKKKDSTKEKKFFQDFMKDDGDDLFAFLDGISKKVHTEDLPNYSGRKALGEKDLFKDIIKARDASDKNNKNKTNDEEIDDIEDEEDEGDYIDEDEEEEEGFDGEEGEGEEEFDEDEEEGEEDIEGEEFDEDEEDEEFEEEEEGEEFNDEEEEGLEFGDEEGEEFEFGEADGEELDAEAIKKIKKQIEADAAKKLKEKLHGGEEDENEASENEEQQEDENKNNEEEILKSRTRFDREELLKHLDPQKKLELERVLRGSINRVAEGNIESIFKQLVELYNKNPKYVINELYSDILMKSCVEQPHVLQLILATNACMLSGLFHLLGDDFLADFIRKFFLVFRENFPKVLDKSLSQNVESEGERPEIYKTRNIVLMLCFLYDFDALNEDFMQHLLFYIANNLSDDTIAYLGIVIQNSGYKIRQNNPTAVKLIMEYIQKKYEEKKVAEAEKAGQLSKKMEFIFMNINDLKHNKKMINDIQDKLTFLVGWLKKSVTSKSGKAHKRFPTRFDDIMTNDFSHPRWWMPVHILNAQQGKEPKQDFTKEILGSVHNEQLDQLEKFAAEQRFTSDIRKKIFLVIMSSDDYIDATQKLMKMKLKKQDKEIAIVIVESCAQEERFNKYYAYLAENLIRQNRSIKYSFQYSFWDHFKQLETYALRKISNLAKLLSFLVLRRALGVHVLQALEFDSLTEHQILFVKIFFKTLLLDIDTNKISDLFKAVNENENFTGFREGLKDYFQEKMLKDLKKSPDGEIQELRDRIKRCCQIIKGF